MCRARARHQSASAPAPAPHQERRPEGHLRRTGIAGHPQRLPTGASSLLGNPIGQFPGYPAQRRAGPQTPDRDAQRHDRHRQRQDGGGVRTRFARSSQTVSDTPLPPDRPPPRRDGGRPEIPAHPTPPGTGRIASAVMTFIRPLVARQHSCILCLVLRHRLKRIWLPADKPRLRRNGNHSQFSRGGRFSSELLTLPGELPLVHLDAYMSRQFGQPQRPHYSDQAGNGQHQPGWPAGSMRIRQYR